MMAQTTSREAVRDRIIQIAERVGASEGVDIVDVEWKGGGGHRMLRIYIDKAEGVTHGDCEFISRQVGTILDVEDVIPGGRYTMEVSSPGLERKLSKACDFERFVGRRAKVLLQEPIADRRHWEGTLTGFANGLITLAPASGNPVSFPLETVERANLKFDW